jgi:uncharacterized damage-inducible protein DinB
MKVRLLLIALVLPVFAQARTPTAPRVAAPPLTGFRAEFVANLDEVERKILDLAESTPADKYSWRPAGDVRSISEVYMHIAGSNYFLATYLGTPAPTPARDLEKSVTRKDSVIAELRKSFDHLRSAAAHTKNLDAQVKLFNNPTTHRGVMLTILTHVHEHLGQSIAYARTNGVTPPWSRQ